MLHVIAVFDGRPGHEKQTLGIIAALRRRTPVKINRIEICDYTMLDKGKLALQLCCPFFAPWKQAFLKTDLIIGTGSRTHITILMLGRKYNKPACTCMTPSLLLRNLFDFCFVPEHDRTPAASNIYYTVGAPNTLANLGCHQPDEGLILLGGIDASSHHWDDEKIVSMVKEVIKRKDDANWTISSSPRTPLSTVDKISALCSEQTNASFFAYRDTPQGWVEEQYNRCKIVWVTSDSISMVYEAMSAGCCVNIFPMEWKNPKGKFSENENILVRAGKVKSFTDWVVDGRYASVTVKLEEAQRCADKILETWWPKI